MTVTLRRPSSTCASTAGATHHRRRRRRPCPAGAVGALLGPNGAGKSTLLHLIAGHRASRMPAPSRLGGPRLAALRRRERARRIALAEQERGASARPAGRGGRRARPHPAPRRLSRARRRRRPSGRRALPSATSGLRDLADREYGTPLGRRAPAGATSPGRSRSSPSCCCSTSRPTTSTCSAQLTMLGARARARPRRAHRARRAARPLPRGRVLRPRAAAGRRPGRGIRTPAEVLQPAIIATVYGVEADVIAHPLDGRPVIVFSESAPRAPDAPAPRPASPPPSPFPPSRGANRRLGRRTADAMTGARAEPRMRRWPAGSTHEEHHGPGRRHRRRPVHPRAAAPAGGDPAEATGHGRREHGRRHVARRAAGLPRPRHGMYTLGGGSTRSRAGAVATRADGLSDELAAYGRGWSWFTLGDLDLATHIARTDLLREGCRVAGDRRARRRWQPGVTLLPMTTTRSRPTCAGDGCRRAPGGDLHFEEWWVRLPRGARRGDASCRSELATATPAPGVLEAIADADVVVLPPSNPVVSVGTILADPRRARGPPRRRPPGRRRRPIIGGAAVRGMADACLTTIGVETSAVAVARHYGRATRRAARRLARRRAGRRRRRCAAVRGLAGGRRADPDDRRPDHRPHRRRRARAGGPPSPNRAGARRGTRSRRGARSRACGRRGTRDGERVQVALAHRPVDAVEKRRDGQPVGEDLVHRRVRVAGPRAHLTVGDLRHTLHPDAPRGASWRTRRCSSSPSRRVRRRRSGGRWPSW